MAQQNNLALQFVDRGWIVLNLSDRAERIVQAARKEILDRLRSRWVAGIESLENYHAVVQDDQLHTDIQEDITEIYQQAGFGQMIIHEEVEVLSELAGRDLHVQKHPYLRIARPECPQDNIGIHRDTHYGSSAYELSISIPFTHPGPEGSLGVISGSHLKAESEFPIRQTKSASVEKLSRKHKLGFPYAPKLMPDHVLAQIVPVELRVGQALVFSLSLVHGQVVNRSKVSRFQSDIRVVNSLAPIQWERNVHADYYEELISSPVTKQARLYYAACKAKDSA